MFLAAKQNPAVVRDQQSGFVDVRHLLQDGEAIESRRYKETSFRQAGRRYAIQSIVEFRR